jgi:hypothetical protein
MLLNGHAQAEAGHHLLMIADVRSLAPALPFAGWELLRGPLVTRLAQGGSVASRFPPFRQRQTTKFRTEEGRLFDANRQLNPRFLRIMDEMAKTIGITRRFVKFDHLFSQNIVAQQLAPFSVGQ